MAEIKIEKKTPMWPWILVALAIIAIIIYFVASSDDNNENDNRQDPRQEQRNDGTVQEQRNDGTSYVAPDQSTVLTKFNHVCEDFYQLG